MNFIENIKNRLSSDRGDSTSISNIFWIALTVVVVVSVSVIVARAVGQRSRDLEACLNSAQGNITNSFHGTNQQAPNTAGNCG